MYRLTLILGLLFLVSACSDDDDYVDRVEVTEGGWYHLLSFVPGSSRFHNEVILTDYGCLAERTGVSRPSFDATRQEMDEYRRQTVYGGDSLSPPLTYRESRLVLGNGTSSHSEALTSELGFNWSNIDIVIEGAMRGEHYIAISGDFDVAKIQEAVRSSEPWNRDLIETRIDAFDAYIWGQQGSLMPGMAKHTPVHTQAIGYRLGASSDTVLWTQETWELEAMVQAGNGQIRSIPTVLGTDIIDRLEGSGVCSAYWGTGDSTSIHGPDLYALITGEYGKAVVDSLIEKDLVLGPYHSYGLGIGEDDHGPFAVLMFSHLNEEQARENGTRLKRILRDGTRLASRDMWSKHVDDVEIRVDGKFVEAYLRPASPRLMFLSIDNLDTPLIHE